MTKKRYTNQRAIKHTLFCSVWGSCPVCWVGKTKNSDGLSGASPSMASKIGGPDREDQTEGKGKDLALGGIG